MHQVCEGGREAVLLLSLEQRLNVFEPLKALLPLFQPVIAFDFDGRTPIDKKLLLVGLKTSIQSIDVSSL